MVKYKVVVLDVSVFDWRWLLLYEAVEGLGSCSEELFGVVKEDVESRDV